MNPHVEFVPFAPQYVNRMNFYFHRLEFHFDILSRQFVSRSSLNLLRRDRGRSLPDPALEPRQQSFNYSAIETDGLRFRDGLTFGVIGIGGVAELHRAFIQLVGLTKKLG